MRGIVRQMLAGRRGSWMGKRSGLCARLGELTAAETHHAAEIQREEGEQDSLNQRIYTLDAELRQNQRSFELDGAGSGSQREPDCV